MAIVWEKIRVFDRIANRPMPEVKKIIKRKWGAVEMELKKGKWRVRALHPSAGPLLAEIQTITLKSKVGAVRARPGSINEFIQSKNGYRI